MKKTPRVLFAVFLWLGFYKTALAQERRFEFACQVVVPDQNSQFGEWISVGSCFYVREGGEAVVVTNEHVSRFVLHSQRLFAVFNNARIAIVPITLRAYQPLRDVAIFDLASRNSISLPAPARFGSDPKTGDRVRIITSSGEHYIEDFDNIEGRVVNTEFNSENAFHPSFLKIQSSTIDGTSGSPVIDSLGNVVGMLTGTLTTNMPVAGFRTDTISVDIPSPSGGTPISKVPGFGRDTILVKLRTGHSVAVPASDIVFLIRRSRGLFGGQIMAPGGLTGVTIRVCRQDINGCGEYPVVIVRVLDPDLRQAGVEPNDVLSAVNGTPLFSGADFTRELFLRRAPGEEVELTLLRRGAGDRLREIKVRVILGDGSNLERGY